MSITSSSLPFTQTLVAAAPEAPGVFALWQGGGIVYYGRTTTIPIALDEQPRARSMSAQRVTRCSREVVSDPPRPQTEPPRQYTPAPPSPPPRDEPPRPPPDWTG